MKGPSYFTEQYINCFLSAFSTVVADNQFSTLGIVLLAALARLSKITGISHQLKIQPVASKSKPTPVVAKEDLGERIRRIDDAPLTRAVKVLQSDSKVASKVSKVSKVSKEKKTTGKPTGDGVLKTTKKKKKKNAIDDLFSGLF
jgi:ribonuclease MRP protein subunit RMP1